MRPQLEDALNKLESRIRYARAVHPEGASFAALLAEYREAEAEDAGSERERDELLDVACVAIRLHLGERQT